MSKHVVAPSMHNRDFSVQRTKQTPTSLKNPASPLLVLLRARPACRATTTVAFPPFDLVSAPDGCVDGKFEDVVDALHLFAAALDVGCAHTVGYGLALGRGDGSEALGLEEVYAGSFCSEVGFETNEDERGCGAEVEDFGVPL